MTGDLHIEPRAASSCVRFAESMRSRYLAALTGAPLLGGRALQFVGRSGVNAHAHGAIAGARTPQTKRTNR